MLKPTKPQFAFCLFPVLASSLLLLFSMRPVQAQPTYTITDLGTLEGGSHVEPFDVNSKGEVVGLAIISDGNRRAFLWLPAADYGLSTGMHDLGTLTVGDDSYATGINDAGQVVGRSGDAFGRFGSTITRAFIWDSVHGMQDLGSLPGNASASAFGINNPGQAVGHSQNYSGDPNTRAVIWSAGAITDIGTLDGNSYSIADHLNSCGQVIGSSAPEVPVLHYHAFIWTPSSPNANTGSMQDLGTLGGTYVDAFAINDFGKVVGDSFLSGTVGPVGSRHAYLWIPTTPNGTTGTMQDLGVLGGNVSYAFGINNQAEIVGGSQIANGDTTEHAFIYNHGAMIDLNTLIASGSGWALERGIRINNSGQITGFGNIDGQRHGFLLTPGLTPTDKDQCKNDRWREFTNPRFKNQGQCVSFVVSHSH